MRSPIHPHHIGRVLAATGVAAIGIGMMGPVSADPPGNNGTIKIDGVEFDAHPDNEPHVSCTFQVDFYGYEAEVPVTMEFSVQPPTGDDVIRTEAGVLDDDDATGGGSEAGLDGQFRIDLTDDLAGFTPQPNQGYHVKLLITADDGTPQGSDGKSKVFWVGPCETPGTTTTTTTTSTSVPTTPTTGSTTTASVLDTSVTQTSQQGAEVLGIQLARTGISAVFLQAGLTALGLGLVLEALAQVAKRRGTVS